MQINQPKFGSLFVVKTSRKEEDFPTKQAYYDAWNGVGKASAQVMDGKIPASVTSLSGGSSLDYPVTLPDGTEVRILAKSNKDEAVLHIVSGTQKDGVNNPVDRSTPVWAWENLRRRFWEKQPVLTAEEISDIKVETILRNCGLPYEIIAFEAFKDSPEKA